MKRMEKNRSVLWGFRAVCIIMLLLCCAGISGCTLYRKHLNPHLTFPERPYTTGVTHRDEVLEEMGPPLKMTCLSGGYAFMYEGLDTQEFQLGVSLPIPVISWFKFVIAEADYEHLVLIYIFDTEHRLVASAGSDSQFDLGSTAAVQPVYAVKMLFDTSAVENEIVDFTQWSTYCLRPLPETLNRKNAVNIGVTGVERRGTSPFCGQRTLEIHQ